MDDNAMHSEPTKQARSKVQHDIDALLSNHKKWAGWDLRAYQWIKWISILSSVCAGVAAIRGDHKYLVAAAAFLPIVLLAVQSHINFKRRLRWNNRYVREVSHLNVMLDSEGPLVVSEKLKQLRQELDSAKNDPDEEVPDD